MNSRYYYRIEKITHRPTAEDLVTLVKEVREEDLKLARILATQNFLEESQDLSKKYSPGSFNSYDTRKGIGYNFQLLLIDTQEEEFYTVDSTMEKIYSAVQAQQEEEKAIFQQLGLTYSDFEL